MRKRLIQTKWPILVTVLLGCIPPFRSVGYPIWEAGRVNAYIQSISITKTDGIGICLTSLLLSLWIAGFWLYETSHPRNDFSPRKQPIWKYWAFFPALLAFWEPVNPNSGLPDFQISYWITSSAGLAFCMMTPLYLAILITFYPKVNRNILQITSLVGFGYALGNLYIAFFFNIRFWWVGILHLPLLILSITGLILSGISDKHPTNPPRPRP